jgi:putative hemolysin
MTAWLVLPFMAALLVASAFFSASETALFSLQRDVVAELASSKSRRAQLAAALLAVPRELLATILFGNLIVNMLFYSFAALTAWRLAESGKHLAAGVVGAAGLFTVILFGEILPKTLALAFNRMIALNVSLPLYGIYTVLRPVRYLAGAVVRVLTTVTLRIARPPSRITREELSMLVESTSLQGHIPPQEGEMIEGVMGLGETRVSDILVPRVDIVACPRDTGPEGLIEIFRKTRRTKIVVYEGDIDHTVGIAYVKDCILDDVKSIDEVMRPAFYVPEAKTAESLLFELRQKRMTIAVVVDEYGGTAGIVALADLAREIVGPIGDEYEAPEKLVEEIAPGRYRLAGDISLKEWNELFDTYVEEEKLSTLGGFVVMLLGRVPRVGDKAVYENIRFTVEEMRKHRIVSIRAELLDELADEAGGRS